VLCGGHFQNVEDLKLIRPCHSALERVRMIANHPGLSHTRLATLRSTESMLGARNRVFQDPTTLNNSGIQIHGGPVPQFLTMVTDGVQGVSMMAAHSQDLCL
jgi:hypothetical protein